ncbi:MAG: hypothetical protein MHPDNHAH_00529 [Anaerolineales bacterium]|nr:hypothetical protein [Anaerolineales bacterium]WKZ49480.1 MAG: hypothetical protein QY306_08920 [Anaerolineales bacterium]
MKLSPEDAALFFKLMPALQVFANQRLHVIKKLEDVEQYKNISNEQRVKLRNAVYKQPGLINDFVLENQPGFPVDDLAVVSEWKNFISGDFYIERILKKYAVFVGNSKVYGVLALSEPFEHVLGGMPLPAYVKTVLLPFKGKIIYDGLLEGYNLIFGRGISSDISNLYLAAKQQGTIIESLDPDGQPPQPKVIIQKDWKPLLRELLDLAAKLRTSKDESAILNPAFDLIRRSLDFAHTAVENPDDSDALEKPLRKVERMVEKIREVMFYSDFKF